MGHQSGGRIAGRVGGGGKCGWVCAWGGGGGRRSFGAGMGLWSEVVERVARGLAFFPPEPPSYAVRSRADGTLELCGEGALFEGLLGGTGGPGRPPRLSQCEVKRLRTAARAGGGGDSSVVALWIPCPGARLTILHSHANAVDLGGMQFIWRQLSAALRVNILGYDYSGYGESAGEPSIRNCLADCEACYDYLVQEKGVPEEQIVLYGQSLGTGPTCELGSRKPQVGGVVLHSPLASGVRVLSPSLRWWPIWCDIFPNFKLVEKIQAPTLIMHGTKDEVIHISHAYLLHERCGNPYPSLFAEGYTHQNIEQSPDFLPTLHQFLMKIQANCDAGHTGSSRSAIDRAGTI